MLRGNEVLRLWPAGTAACICAQRGCATLLQGVALLQQMSEMKLSVSATGDALSSSGPGGADEVGRCKIQWARGVCSHASTVATAQASGIRHFEHHDACAC